MRITNNRTAVRPQQECGPGCIPSDKAGNTPDITRRPPAKKPICGGFEEGRIENVKRGDIYYADLRPVVGSEQGGIRPVLIIQNDIGNRHSPTVICAAITSKMNKAKLPTHIEILAADYEIEKDSVILLEQLRTIDKKRLKDKVCHLDAVVMARVNRALKISLELDT